MSTRGSRSAATGVAPRRGADADGLAWVLAALCVTQITSWGVLYYAFPVLSPLIAADTGWSAPAVTAAFSAGLVVAAVVGIPVGRALDRRCPRGLITGGSVVAAIAVVSLAVSPGLVWFAAGWLVAGVAMAAVLYQPAFAALTRYYGPRHLTAITTLTLVAGLSSTLFAPLTDALAAHLSWRGVYLVLAAILAAVTVPLHAWALSRPWPERPARRRPRDGERTGNAGPPADEEFRAIVRSRPFWLLAAAFTLSAFTMYAFLTHLIPLLVHRGADPTAAAWALGLGGVGQVAGRLGYTALVARTSVRSRIVGTLAASAVITAAVAVVPGPLALLIALAVLAGAVRGIATLLQATAVGDRWGTAFYGSLSGVLAAPIMLAAAVAPWAGAVLATSLGGYPAVFMTLTAVAALAAVLAAGSVPRTPSTPVPDVRLPR
ncbi:MFS transporter [Thermomonospora umbrina]|uniref:MFS transporter n=1 Tax=Thermomonospora umbrina TaxID=111806 RepID=UPI000E24D9D1|nr:MFS transporter [Thermomonospora umbrina]